MKKFIGLVVLIIFIIFGYLYINRDKKAYEDINDLNITQDKLGIINDYYIYGNHFNIRGSIDIDNDITNYKLVLKNKDKEIDLDCNFDDINFFTSDLINKGVNLDKLDIGTYYLLIKDNDKYYNLKNNTDY